MLQHDQVFTRSAFAKQFVKASENIFQEKNLFDTCSANIQRREKLFWTKEQRDLVEGDPKRVLFTSNYGTGKTLVMRAKAMQLGRKRHLFVLNNQVSQDNMIDPEKNFSRAKAKLFGRKKQQINKINQDIVNDPGKTFIILFTNQDALLFHSIHQEFENLQDHVQVVCFQGKSFSSCFIKVVRELCTNGFVSQIHGYVLYCDHTSRLQKSSQIQILTVLKRIRLWI
jgi:hypothetical protein